MKTINDTLKEYDALNKEIIDEIYPLIGDIVNSVDESISEQKFSEKQIREVCIVVLAITKLIAKRNIKLPFDTIINMASCVIMLKDFDKGKNNLKDFKTYLKIVFDMQLSICEMDE